MAAVKSSSSAPVSRSYRLNSSGSTPIRRLTSTGSFQVSNSPIPAALGGPQQSHDHLDGGGLAGPVLAEQP
jgi:hypothetical protein